MFTQDADLETDRNILIKESKDQTHTIQPAVHLSSELRQIEKIDLSFPEPQRQQSIRQSPQKSKLKSKVTFEQDDSWDSKQSDAFGRQSPE